jgi:hypothetical protein
MSKVTDVRVVDGEDAADVPELSDELRVALTDIAAVAREGLLAMSVAVGLQVMAELMDDEVTATVGPKHARLADRTAHDRDPADLRQFGANFDIIAPAPFLSMVVPLAIFLSFQRYFVQGMLAGAAR